MTDEHHPDDVARAMTGGESKGLSAEELDRLEALAKQATPGRWGRDVLYDEDAAYGAGPDHGTGFHASRLEDEQGRAIAISAYDLAEVHEEYDEDGSYAWDETAKRNFEFIASASPPTVLRLIAQARRASSSEPGREGLRAALKAQVRPLDETLSAFSVLKDEFFPEARSATAIGSPSSAGDRGIEDRHQHPVYLAMARAEKMLHDVLELEMGSSLRDRVRESHGDLHDACHLFVHEDARTVSPVSEGALRKRIEKLIVDNLLATPTRGGGVVFGNLPAVAHDVMTVVLAALPTAEAKPGAGEAS